MSNEERIAVLELQYRNMRRIVLGIAAVITLNFAICSIIIVGFVVSTTSVPDVIRAQKLEVVNAEGKAVVGLGADREGGGLLRIFNQDGKLVAGISAGAEGGGVVRTLDGNGELTSQSP
jgi:hypothetical protein